MLKLIEKPVATTRPAHGRVDAASVPTDHDRLWGDPDLAAMLETVRDLLGVRSIAAHLIAASGDLGQLVAGVGPELAVERWLPAVAERLARGPTGSWLSTSVGESEIHASLLKPRARDRLVLLCCGRCGQSGDRRQLERRIASFLPLIERTVGQWARSHVQEMRLKEQAAVFDALNTGLIVVDADCRVHLINAAARAQVAELGVLSMPGDRLSVRQFEDAMRFQVSLRHVLGDTGTQRDPVVVALRRAGPSPVLLAISAMPPSATGARRAAVQIVDPQAKFVLPLETLSRYYDLTQAEGRLIEQLVRGRTLGEAASALRLKEQTARTYLKHIFQKTGLRRQVELIRLVLAGALPSFGLD